MGTAPRRRSAFETFYSVVVLVKGVDGLVELLAGILLLVAPGVIQQAVLAVADELDEGTSAVQAAVAGSLDRAGASLSGGDPALAAFLLVHGLVKLTTVYLLLRRLVKWYPAAIVVLSILLTVQTVSAVIAPSVGAWTLAVLDLIVLLLVVLEYRRLRSESSRRDVSSRPAAATAAATGSRR